jgi:DKNYY family
MINKTTQKIIIILIVLIVTILLVQFISAPSIQLQIGIVVPDGEIPVIYRTGEARQPYLRDESFQMVEKDGFLIIYNDNEGVWESHVYLNLDLSSSFLLHVEKDILYGSSQQLQRDERKDVRVVIRDSENDVIASRKNSIFHEIKYTDQEVDNYKFKAFWYQIGASKEEQIHVHWLDSNAFEGFYEEKNNGPYKFKLLGTNYAINKSGVYFANELVDGADPKQFEILDSGYAKDAEHLYFGKMILDESDPSTFEVLKSFYVRDEHNLYFRGKLVDGADPNTFDVVYNNYVKDENSLYVLGERLDESDPSTFILLEDHYAKDKNYVYFKYKVVDGADSDTFESLDSGYAKDINNAYLQGKGLEEVKDVTTFEVFGYRYATDQYNVYYYGRLIEGADSETFEVIEDGYAKDKNAVYMNGRNLEEVDPDEFLIEDYLNKGLTSL